MMMEWPLTPFSEIDAHPLVAMDTALAQWQAAVAAMSSGQHPADG
jgi:hypothetical protein